jgi:hypothetical protein
MLRGQDTRGGFEATADMLSITGLTLEQFADLMGGLGYKAERGERPKVKAAPEPAAGARGDGCARKPWTKRPGRRAADGPGRGRHARPDPAGDPCGAAGRSTGLAPQRDARRRALRDRRRRPRRCPATCPETPRRTPRGRTAPEPETRGFLHLHLGTAPSRRRPSAAPGRGWRRQAARSEAEGGGKPGKGGKRWQGRQGPSGRPAHLHGRPTSPPRSIPTIPSRCWPRSRTSPERAACRPTGWTGGSGMRGSSRPARSHADRQRRRRARERHPRDQARDERGAGRCADLRAGPCDPRHPDRASWHAAGPATEAQALYDDLDPPQGADTGGGLDPASARARRRRRAAAWTTCAIPMR